MIETSTLFTCLFLVLAILLACKSVLVVWLLKERVPDLVRKWRIRHHRSFLIVFLLLGFLATGMTCNQNQQTATFNTLYSLEKSTVAAYDGYLAAVLAGQARTNEVPKISHAFNDFQAAMVLAADTDQAGTNALAPPALVAQSADLLNLITVAKGAK